LVQARREVDCGRAPGKDSGLGDVLSILKGSEIPDAEALRQKLEQAYEQGVTKYGYQVSQVGSNIKMLLQNIYR
jgi:hypothetical protein